jgi:dienelactone hydrolase
MRALRGVAALAVTAAVLAPAADATVSPTLAQACRSPIKATPLTLRTTDSVRLFAATLGSGRVGIVLAAQHYGVSCEWVPEAKRLAAAGYRVLVFDNRNRGHSQSVGPLRSKQTDLDVVAAADALRRLGAKKIVLVGSLLSGLSVVDAAASVRPPVAAIIAIAPPDKETTTRENDARLIPAAKHIRVPALFLVGNVGGVTPPETKNLYAWLDDPAKQLLKVKPALRGVDVFADPATAAAVMRFIATHTG